MRRVLLLLCWPMLQAVAAAPASEDGWTSSGHFGLNLAQGNSDSLWTTAGLDTTGRFDPWEAIGSISAIYGEDEGVRSSERVDVLLQLNRDLDSSRFYGGLTAEYLYDPVAAIDYRYGLMPVLGVRLIDNDRIKLRVEAGPGYVWEDRDGVKRGYGSLRLSQRFSYQINKGNRLFQSLTAVTEAGEFDNALVTAEAGFESKLDRHWSLRLVAKAIHYGEAHGKTESDDLLLTAGLGYNFAPKEKSAKLKEVHEAQEGKRNHWIITAFLGGASSSGNTEKQSVAGGVLVRRERRKDEWELGLRGNYAENGGRVSAEQLSASARYEDRLSGLWFAGVQSDFRHDSQANLDWRLAVGPFFGGAWINNKRTRLSGEAGPSFLAQRQGGSQDSFVAARAAFKVRHRIGSGTNLHAETNWLSDGSNWSNYLLTSEVGVAQEITETTTLKFILLSQYDTTPAKGRERHDLQLISALGFSF